MLQDTILAIATAPGSAGIGVLRLGGPQACAAADLLFAAADGRPLAAQEPRRLCLGRLRLASGELLDEVLAVRFPAEASWTGEELVELQAHGGDFHLGRLQAALLEAGSALAPPLRLAGPGEFTRRAFLNGKLDLTRAEAVADLIHSTAELSSRAAAGQLAGGLQAAVEGLRSQLLGLLAEAEAGLDFPEEEAQLAPREQRGPRLEAALADLEALLGTARRGRALSGGLGLVLVGPPNAGKSSLFNALLGRPRAIVAAEPGTTRDWLEAGLQLRGWPLRLVDTAGLRESAAEVEAEGVRRSRELARGADLLLLVLDRSQPLAPGALDILAAAGEDWLIAANKCDAPAAWGLRELRARWPGAPPQDLESRLLPLSARSGQGLGELLERALERGLRGRAAAALEPALLTQARHEAAARQAQRALRRARGLLAREADAALLAADLREAWEALGSITGASPRAEVVEEIFKRFCIGK